MIGRLYRFAVQAAVRRPGWIAACFLLLLSIPALGIAVNFLEQARATSDERLRLEARALLDAVYLGGIPEVRRDLASFRIEGDPFSLALVQSSGRTFGKSIPERDRAMLLELVPGTVTSLVLSSGPVRALRERAEDQFHLKGEGYDDVVVVVASSQPSSLELAARNVTAWAGLAALISVIFAVCVQMYYQRNYRIRLAEINLGLDRVKKGDFIPITLSGSAPREIERLASNSNIMINSLSERVRSLRIFVEVAAHELRTPLTRMRLSIDRMVRSDQPPALLDLRDIGSDTRELLRLFESLLGLAQTQAQLEDQSAFEMIRLDELLRELAEDQEGAFSESGLVLRCVADEPTQVQGELPLVRRLFENLLENARKYAAPASVVECTLTLWQGGFRVTVTNGGGFPSDIRARAFEPHTRSAEAKRMPGYGLGLHVARAIVLKHQWSIELGGTEHMAIVTVTGSTAGDDRVPKIS